MDEIKKNPPKKNAIVFIVAILIVAAVMAIGIPLAFKDENSNQNNGDAAAASSQSSTEADDLAKTIKDLQSDVYSAYKTYVYDKVDGSMYYSDVDYMMQSVHRQLKSALPSLTMSMDPFAGTYFPKWIVSVTISGQTYPLVYIEIECNSSFKVQRKHIGTYKY